MSNKYALLFLLLCSVMFSAQAQTNPGTDSLSVSPQPDRLADSLQLSLPITQPQDTLLPGSMAQDSVTQDSLAQNAAARKSDIETTINYNAKDSIRLDFRNKTMYMYGTQTSGSGQQGGSGGGEVKSAGSAAKIDYGQIKLEAAYITTNWETNLLTANALEDSTGRKIGRPVFTDGPEQFVTDNIKYNFKSKKAVIKGIVTQQQDAYIHGETVKKTPDNALLIENARYTTCNLEHPHFHIEASKLKVLPGDKIISGPFHLKIANISTPLGFMFGMFPAPKKRVSGVIFPTYGEERKRGFFLRNGGYYWAVNDYVDLAVTGEIYTRGSYGMSVASNYRKRYAYNGGFNVHYNRLNTAANEGIEEYSTSLAVNWNHSPQTKGNGRFNASVNFRTGNYTTNNPSLVNPNQNLQQDLSSNISYSYSNLLGLPLNFSSRASLTQKVVANGISPTDLLLPDVSLTMARQYPFKRTGSTGKTWWEQIGVGYTFRATNRLSNKPLSLGNEYYRNPTDIYADSLVTFAPENLAVLLKRGKVGAHHKIPISTSFNMFKHFQVSPSFNYDEFWFLERMDYNYNADLNKVMVDTLRGFHRAGVYNTGASVGTKLFGTFYFNKRNPQPRIQAIRHMMIPTVGFNYSPDFTSSQFGYFQEVQTGIRNEEPIYKTVSVFQGAAYTVPGGRETAALTFGLNNSIEMKVRSKGDTAQEYRKVPLLRNLSINTSYNLIAEEFKLSPLNISANTSLLDNLITLNINGRLNPYVYELEEETYNSRGERQVVQTMVDEYAWNNGKGIGSLETAGFNLNTNLSPATFKRKGAAPKGGNTPGVTGEENMVIGQAETGEPYIYNNPNEYVDFTIPWTLRFSYNYSYSKIGFQDPRTTQTTSFNGSLKVTEKWQLTFGSSYDIVNNKFTQTNFSIYRDLHCWEMSVSWIPFGYAESFSVNINVKSPTLQDLKISRRRSWFDN